MPKKSVKSKPLLYIAQPEFEVTHSQMQSRYYIKAHMLERQKVIDDKWVVTEEVEEVNDKWVITEEVEEANDKRVVTEEVEEANDIWVVTEEVEEAIDKWVVIEEVEESIAALTVANEEEIAENDAPLMVESEVPDTHGIMQPEEEMGLEMTDLHVESTKDITEEIDPIALETSIGFDHEMPDLSFADLIENEETIHPNETIETAEGERHRQKQKEIWEAIVRLSRYPKVIQRPYCEVTVNDKTWKCKVESKRGDIVKLRKGSQVNTFKIEEITDIKILDWKKG